MKRIKETIVNFPNDHPIWFWLILVAAETVISEIIGRFLVVPHSFYLFFANSAVESQEGFKAFKEEALLGVGVGVRLVALVTLALVTGFVIWRTNKKKQKQALESQIEGLTQRESKLNQQLSKEKKRNRDLETEEAPFKEIRCLVEDLSEYTNQSDVVDSIQIFEYSSLPNLDKLSPDDVIEVEFRFKDGTASSKANVNVLYNICYQLPCSIYTPLMELLKKRNDYFAQHKCVKNADTEQKIQRDAIELFGKISDILGNLENPSQILDQHYALYRVLQMLVTIVITKEKRVSCQQLLAYKEGVEDQLKVGMRTGLLGSLLLQRMYCFANENSVYKQGRSYFAAPLEYNSHKFIMLVVLQRNKLRIDSNEDELHYCTAIYDEIELLLKNNAKRRGEACLTQ